MHIRDIDVEYRFKQLSGELETELFHRMIHLTRYTDNPDMANLSHHDIHDYFESMTNPDPEHEAALFVAEQKILGRVVGLAGVRIDTTDGERTARLTEFMVNPEAHRAAQLGKRLVEEVIEWGQDQGIHQVTVPAAELPENRAAQLVPVLEVETADDSRPTVILV